ncbi:MAG: iron ABC transporter permease [Anaerolineae bacterium]|nr:iron ABC transporter permease [Anaerolineae bacterium]
MDRSRPGALNAWRRWAGNGVPARAGQAVLLLPVIFLALFFLYPLLAILDYSLRPAGVVDLSGFARIITSAYYRDTVVFTIGQAALSTLFTLALALPGAYVFVRYDFPGRDTLLALSAVPFVLPTVVVAAAFSALIGERGLVNSLLMSVLHLADAPLRLERTLAIILIVHVFYNYAVALRLITAYWANQSPRMEEAARLLGCAGWRLWWEIRLPLLRPALLAAAVLVFIFTFTSFGVVLILGGVRFATLEVQIYYQALNLFDLPVAAALALVQMALMFGLLLVYTRLQRQMSVDWQSVQRVARAPRRRTEKLFLAGNLLLMAGLLFAPPLALLLRSLTFASDRPTLAYYLLLTQNPRDSILFVPPLYAIGNSLVFALVTLLLALVLGVLTAILIERRQRWLRWLDALFMLPLVTSAVTLGFGYLIALDEPPLALRASPVIIPIAHTLVALPFVVRSLLPALRAIPPTLAPAAVTLGAAPWQVWRFIRLPLLSRSLVVGATFAFTVSMGEFGASLFIARPDTPTLPVVIFRLLGQPGADNYGQALALSVLLMLVCSLSFIIIERSRSAGVGEF